jgi:DNA-binding PucR family transcriptional regulator
MLDVDEATRLLGHRLHPGQWGIVLWQSEPTDVSDPLARLEGVVRDLAVALGAPRPLTLPEGARALTAWINLPHDPEPRTVARVVEAAGSGVHLAAGTVSPGVIGFRSSNRQAVQARRVAQASVEPGRITEYRSVAAVGPFLDDPEALADLVRTELGGLAARDDNAARLRETALAYLRTGCSARDAAASIGVHKNTVLYRLRGIEDGLGRSLAERTLALEVALELVERIGPGVLP